MSSTYGEKYKITVFGQSHSPAIGVTIEGLPAGFEIDTERLRRFMSRRAPGRDETATARKEADAPEFISGLVGSVTCGAPLTAIIRNTNQHSSDYDNLRDTPRPGHADYTAAVKYGGAHDIAGGGHFSGRLTAPVCIAGGIALQILEEKGITVGAHILKIAKIADESFDCVNIDKKMLESVSANSFPVICDAAGEKMREAVLLAKADGDSVGGVIECAAVGLPCGVGEPMFDGIENKIAAAAFGIPAVKGIEFGSGFTSAEMRGSENNDSFYCDDSGTVRTKTNNAGGILGGITNGMPLVFRIAVKPTPSIAMEQDSVSLSEKTNKKLTIKGRHDPCIVPRAVPVCEAVCAIALLDAILSDTEKHI